MLAVARLTVTPVLLMALAGALPAQPGAPAFLLRDVRLPADAEEAVEAIVCLHAALDAQGFAVDLSTLRALSGEAWTPLLTTGQPVFEPLRERLPLDVLARGCAALGVEGAWHTGLTPAEAVALCAAELSAQRPVLASFLLRPPEEPMGWNLVIGAEPADGDLLLADQTVPRGRTVHHLTDPWEGFRPGPEPRAESPLFTADASAARLPSPETQLRVALAAWREQMAPGPLRLLGSDTGAADVAPGDAVLTVGPTAARALGDQIAALETLDDFPALWRVRTLASLWAERRHAGAAFLRSLEGLREEHRGACTALAASLDAAAATAQTISSLLWNQSFLQITDAQNLLRGLRRDPPLVVDLGGLPAHERELLVESIRRSPPRWVMERHSTRWGPCLTVDGPDQRERIVALTGAWASQMEALDVQAAALAEAL